RPDPHPVRKACRSLQRVVALARKKITQTKFCRVLVHHAIHSLSATLIIALTIVGSKAAAGINLIIGASAPSGSFQQKRDCLSFTRLLTRFAAATARHEVPCRGNYFTGLRI